MTWVFLICIILVCMLLLLYMPLEIHLRLEHWDEGHGFVELRYLFGLIRIRRELTSVKAGLTTEGPTIGVQAEAKNQQKTHKVISLSDVAGFLGGVGPLYSFVKRLTRIIKRFTRRVCVHELLVEANVGLMDAAFTGMAVGALYAVIDTAVGYSSSLCQYRTTPQVNVRPVFNQTLFHVRINGIMRVRIGYAISAGIQLFWVWKRRT